MILQRIQNCTVHIKKPVLSLWLSIKDLITTVPSVNCHLKPLWGSVCTSDPNNYVVRAVYLWLGLPRQTGEGQTRSDSENSCEENLDKIPAHPVPHLEHGLGRRFEGQPGRAQPGEAAPACGPAAGGSIGAGMGRSYFWEKEHPWQILRLYIFNEGLVNMRIFKF